MFVHLTLSADGQQRVFGDAKELVELVAEVFARTMPRRDVSCIVNPPMHPYFQSMGMKSWETTYMPDIHARTPGQKTSQDLTLTLTLTLPLTKVRARVCWVPTLTIVLFSLCLPQGLPQFA